MLKCQLYTCVCVEREVCVRGRFFFFQAEDGIRDLVRSRGLGDVYKRQLQRRHALSDDPGAAIADFGRFMEDVANLRMALDLSLIHI